MEALAKAPALAIGEGYATAGSLSEALGFATVAAFDSGNVPAVAKALNEKFPDKPIVIFGDDDKHLEQTQGVNPGRKKAEEAAKAVGGTVVLPVFAPGEQSGDPKGFTDFNDLANKSALGKEGVQRQAKAAVSMALEKRQATQASQATVEQTQAQTRQQQRSQRQERPPKALRLGRRG
jgi:putative DNA primase/helicase